MRKNFDPSIPIQLRKPFNELRPVLNAVGDILGSNSGAETFIGQLSMDLIEEHEKRQKKDKYFGDANG